MSEDKDSKFNQLRFVKDDAARAGIYIDGPRMVRLQKHLQCENLASSTRIVPELFPAIHAAIEGVRKRLIPDYTVDAYVRNSSDTQAYCFPGAGKQVSIALTSGLLTLFSVDELAFVVGHEIGHFLFGHHAYPHAEDTEGKVEKLNILALSRAAEISADRIGFICTPKKEDAFKAILKLATGLPDQYVRFDLSAYLDQARELHRSGGSEYGLFSTHPVCTTRIRALLWFEMSNAYYSWTGRKEKAPLSATIMDEKISKDLAAASGFRLDEINKKETKTAILWGRFLCLFLMGG